MVVRKYHSMVARKYLPGGEVSLDGGEEVLPGGE